MSQRQSPARVARLRCTVFVCCSGHIERRCPGSGAIEEELGGPSHVSDEIITSTMRPHQGKLLNLEPRDSCEEGFEIESRKNYDFVALIGIAMGNHY